MICLRSQKAFNDKFIDLHTNQTVYDIAEGDTNRCAYCYVIPKILLDSCWRCLQGESSSFLPAMKKVCISSYAGNIYLMSVKFVARTKVKYLSTP